MLVSLQFSGVERGPHIPCELSEEYSNPSTQEVGADHSDQLPAPARIQRIIILAGAAACRSLGKEKIVGRSMRFCCLRTTFLYPNRRVDWIRS